MYKVRSVLSYALELAGLAVAATGVVVAPNFVRLFIGGVVAVMAAQRIAPVVKDDE